MNLIHSLFSRKESKGTTIVDKISFKVRIGEKKTRMTIAWRM